MTIDFMKNERLKQHLIDFLQFLETFKQEKETLPADDSEKAILALSVLQRQHQQRLKQRIAKFHAADIAHILDTLPLEERLSVWKHIPADATGEILLELSDAVRESLLAEMDVQEIVSATEMLDTDEIADLVPDLPDTVVELILTTLSENDRKQLEEVLSYEEGTVGALMDFGMLTVRKENSIDTVLRYFRKLSQLPEYTNQIFVVNRENELQGHVLLQELVTFPFKSLIGEVMTKSKVTFKTEDNARDATQAFDRYELISAAVVDDDDKLIGRICVDDILDFVRESSENELLAQAGFMEGEDLFSGMWKGAKNRWLWLSVNLITAFIATRVIGLFEDTILQVVALAALMPIVAAAGGNSGNQTGILIIRSLALGHITPANIKSLFVKEMGISLINGALWGSAMGLFVYMIYDNFLLGFIMMIALLLNLLATTAMGVGIPVLRYHFNMDPAIGTNIIITFLADSFGFFIFLGLAAILF